MIHDEICTYEVCKLAKEKGFPQHPNKNGKCRIYTLDKSKNSYVLCDWNAWISAPWASEVIAAPTQSLLQRWLREEKGLILIIRFDPSEQMYDWGVFLETQPIEFTSSEEYFEKYELALEDAIKFALENLV